MTWTDEDAEQVRGLLTQFNGADEVCAVMGCDEADLDGLCMAAFGIGFEAVKETFAAQGRALLRRALMQQALDGSAKALDMLARDQLGMGAVESRRKTMEAMDADDDGAATTATGTLTVLQGRRADRRSRAAN